MYRMSIFRIHSRAQFGWFTSLNPAGAVAGFERKFLHTYIPLVQHSTAQYTCTDCFNGHFPDKPGLAGCHLDSQPPVILILSILTGHAKTLRTQRVLQAVLRPLTLTAVTISKGSFWSRMPFLLPNRQCKNTEGKTVQCNTIHSINLNVH